MKESRSSSQNSTSSDTQSEVSTRFILSTKLNDNRSESCKQRKQANKRHRKRPALFTFQRHDDNESQKKSSSATSSDCTYLPSHVQSICQEQYAEDQEEELKDMRLFAQENREVLREFYRGEPQQRRLTRSYTMNMISESNMLALKVGLAIISLIAFLIVVKFGNSTNSVTIAKAASQISSCWDKFKQENCDFSNPISSYCKSLYDCTMRQRNHSRKETHPHAQEQQNESLIEEFAVLFVVLASFYCFGTQNILRYTFILFKYAKMLINRDKKEERDQSLVEDVFKREQP